MTVNALAGGSPASTTVDLSATYLDWARRNLAANGFAASDAGAASPACDADCARPGWRRPRASYDLILLDPPTFSNSKRMGAPPSTCSATTPTSSA